MKNKTTQATNSLISSASVSPHRTDVLDSGSQPPSQQSSKDKRPYLWVSDIICAQKLRLYFRLMSLDTADPASIESGSHIIALDPDFGELNIKRLGHKLLEKGCHVDVFELEQPLLSFLAPIGLDAVPMIVMEAIRFEQWLDKVKDTPLPISETVEQAKFYLKRCGGQRTAAINIELETLRKRCGVSSYDWQKNFIEKLEAEIHAAVDGKAADPHERLKLDISRWLRITDPFKQETERSRIQSTYRIKDKVFERLCRTLKELQKRSASAPNRLSLTKALSMESHALDWLVPGFIPNKTSVMVSGLPGVGKSLLSVDLAHAITTGGKFLGEQCRQGKVLLINSDQPLNITVSYLCDRGFDESNRNLDVVGQSGDMPAWTIHNLEQLESWLEEFKPDLVIIDSIRKAICYPLGLEEKSEQVGHWMSEVERMVIRYGSLLWIHHDNKDKEKHGVSRSSGSTAIPGNVSVHWRLEAASKDPSDPHRVFSMPKTRGFEASSLNLRFNAQTGEWESLGRVGESEAAAAQRQSYQEQILELLSSRPGVGFEGSEIKSLLGGADSVYTVLSRMVARGVITKRRSKTSRGKVYLLAETEDLLTTKNDLPSPPSFTHGSVRLDSETITNQDFQTPNSIPNTTPNTHLTPLMLDEDVSSQNSYPDSNTTTSNTGAVEEGEGVIIENDDSQQSEIIDEPMATETVDTSEVTAVEETVPLHPIAEDEPVAFSIAQEMIAVQNSSRGDKQGVGRRAWKPD
ncbi:MAG: AAA family ATPase [Symploca sp. SIO1A3]|nr:AAA family ATPase [Symploca sp. SIO1A3]